MPVRLRRIWPEPRPGLDLNVGAAAPSFSVGAVLDLSVGAAALSFNTARAPGLDLSVSAAAPAFNVGAVLGLINGAAAPTFKSFEKEIKKFRWISNLRCMMNPLFSLVGC